MLDIHSLKAAAYRVCFDGTHFRFVDSNAACLELVGMSTVHVAGLTPHDIFAPAVAAELVRRYHLVLEGGAASYVTSAAVGNAERRWRTTLFAAPTGPDEVSVFGICGEPEDDMGQATFNLDMLDGGFWTLDLATYDFRTSRRLAEKLAGAGHASLDLAEYVSHIHAEDLVLELPDGDGDMVVEFRAFTHDGRMLWLRTRRRPVRNALGRTTHVVGVVLDITRDKQASMRHRAEAAGASCPVERQRLPRSAALASGKVAAEDAERLFDIALTDPDALERVDDGDGRRIGHALLRELAGRREAAWVGTPREFAPAD